MSTYQKAQLNLFANEKIQGDHRDRLAIVYIRQSTLQQVERHSESTKLQYALVEKACNLGWPAEKVVIIDDDLGRSGASAEGRPGFQRLVAEVGLDRVGIVLGIEMSRLARSCRDWYQLLEVCAMFRTLIGDADGVYDPAIYNDRLLLGLKGTMSEAELHILKQRMLEGKKAKARRGELVLQLPVGYIKHPSGEIIKDPDEQAQAVIQLLFELFERFSTMGAVLKYCVKHRIRIPCRENSGLQKGELAWNRPNISTLCNILHHPIYAGAYVYGRRPTDPRKKKPGQPSTGRRVAKLDEIEVLIKDKVPAYITWEQYERNQRQLAANTLALKGLGAPKHGASLLSGLVICGHCNSRMTTHYRTNGSSFSYRCDRNIRHYGGESCQSLLGLPLDEMVVEQILDALEPSALEISLRVAEDIERERKTLSMHWGKQLERAKYEVERAYRQYNASEPENRLVTRTLEKKWEETLSAEEKLKIDYTKFIAEQPTTLSFDEREAIRELASDIPKLWSSTTTTAQEKKEIIRILIERIVVMVEGKTEKVFAYIHWVGGHKSTHQFNRPVAKFEQLSYGHELLDRIVKLREEGHLFSVIADILNQEGWESPQQHKNGFSSAMIGPLLARRGVQSNKKIRSKEVNRADNEFTIRELSQKTNIPESTLYSWLSKGMLTIRREKEVSHGGIWLITADIQEIKRLQTLKDQLKENRYPRAQKVN